MKKIFLLFNLFGIIISAQEISEPEFIGEALIIKNDNTVLPLEKSTSQIKTNANASAYIIGIGKIKSKIAVDGCCSSTRLKSDENFKIIVRAVDNATDPLAIVRIFSFDSGSSKQRKAELSSLSTFFGGASENNLKYLPFTAKKYSTSSYIITLKEQPKGEFGITVSNPNNKDEKSMIISTFAID